MFIQLIQHFVSKSKILPTVGIFLLLLLISCLFFRINRSPYWLRLFRGISEPSNSSPSFFKLRSHFWSLASSYTSNMLNASRCQNLAKMFTSILALSRRICWLQRLIIPVGESIAQESHRLPIIHFLLMTFAPDASMVRVSERRVFSGQ